MNSGIDGDISLGDSFLEMIRVRSFDEPTDFEDKVRKPGQSYLRENPNPTSAEFNSHAYWRSVIPTLRALYDGICAYSCLYIDPTTGAKNVEHFKPTSKRPDLAYEWSNYRLVCALLNGRKREHEDVLDPFLVEDGWFVLDFPSLLVLPSKSLDERRKAQVEATIRRLRLNDLEDCVESRLRYVRDFCKGEISFEWLKRNAPFIAVELQRQGLTDSIASVMAFDLGNE